MLYDVKNLSGEAIPPFGICRLKSVSGRFGEDNEGLYYEAVKPDGIAGIYCVNGYTELPNNKRRSMRSWETATAVAINPTETVAFGDMIGPVVGQWYASLKGGGYLVLDAKESNDVVPVVFQRETLRRWARMTSNLTVATTMETNEGTGTAVLRKENLSTGHYTDSGLSVTVRNRYEFVQVPSGTVVEILSVFGKWRIVGADCEE